MLRLFLAMVDDMEFVGMSLYEGMACVVESGRVNSVVCDSQ